MPYSTIDSFLFNYKQPRPSTSTPDIGYLSDIDFNTEAPLQDHHYFVEPTNITHDNDQDEQQSLAFNVGNTYTTQFNRAVNLVFPLYSTLYCVKKCAIENTPELFCYQPDHFDTMINMSNQTDQFSLKPLDSSNDNNCLIEIDDFVTKYRAGESIFLILFLRHFNPSNSSSKSRTQHTAKGLYPPPSFEELKDIKVVEEPCNSPDDAHLSDKTSLTIGHLPNDQAPSFTRPYPEIHSDILVNGVSSVDINNINTATTDVRHLSVGLSLSPRKITDIEKIDDFVSTADVDSKKFPDISNVIKEGWLKMSQEFCLQSQLYFFQLKDDGTLYYAENCDTKDTKESQVIDLLDYHIETSLTYRCLDTLKLACGQRTHLLSTHDGGVISTWLRLLEEGICSAKQRFFSSISLQGHLFLETGNFKFWKKKWCYIQNGYLYCRSRNGSNGLHQPNLASDKDSQNNIGNYVECKQTEISLEDCFATIASSALVLNCSRTTGSIFFLHLPNQTYSFLASNNDDLERWITTIARSSLIKAEYRLLSTKSASGSHYNIWNTENHLYWSKFKKHTVSIPYTTGDVLSEYSHPFISEIDSFVSSKLDLNHAETIRCYHKTLAIEVLEKKKKHDIYDVILAPLSISTSSDCVDPVLIRFHFTNTSIIVKSKWFDTFRHSLVSTLHILQRRNFMPDVSVDNFVIKLSGLRYYIFDLDTSLSLIRQFNEQMFNFNPYVELVVKLKSEILNQISSHFHCYSLSEYEEHGKTQRTMSDDDIQDIDFENAIQNVTFECYDVEEFTDHFFSLKVISLDIFYYSDLRHILRNNSTSNSKSDFCISFFVEVGLFVGGTIVGGPFRSSKRSTPYWNELLTTNCHYADLPPELYLKIILYCELLSKPKPIAFSNVSILDYNGALKRGVYEIPMWYSSKTSNCMNDLILHPHDISLTFEFESTPNPIYYLYRPIHPELHVTHLLDDQEVPICGPFNSRYHDRHPMKIEAAKYTFNQSKVGYTLCQVKSEPDPIPEENVSITATVASNPFSQRNRLKASILESSISSQLHADDPPNSSNQTMPSASIPLVSEPNNPLNPSISVRSTNPAQLKISLHKMTTTHQNDAIHQDRSQDDGDVAFVSKSIIPFEHPNLEDLGQFHYLSGSIGPKKIKVLWQNRHSLRDYPKTYPSLFSSLDPLDLDQRKELVCFLETAPIIPPEIAILLLDRRFTNYHIRLYATKCLNHLDDESLASLLIYMVQILTYEPLYPSPFSTFLLERALFNPLTIGFPLFWNIQSNIHQQLLRFRLVQSCLLQGFRKSLQGELLQHLAFVEQLNKISSHLLIIHPNRRTVRLRELLHQCKFPSIAFTTPISPALAVRSIIIDQCKTMNSAKFPLLLTFENEDAYAKPIQLLFKFGDDLRQDALVLQMFGIMDRLWKEEGLDMNMSIYRCMPTGENMGLIEIIPHSESTAKIQREEGGTLVGAFKHTPIYNRFKTLNPDPKMFQLASDIFTHSCAAYCVATYVLGIGDRHNDNIMITSFGHLFHIDFGYLLGNSTKIGVYKRERAPFALTPAFVHVMGGEEGERYKIFRNLCSHIYNILRRHSYTFISLLKIFLSMNDLLESKKHFSFLNKSLLTGISSETIAGERFLKLIDQSLSCKTTQINFAIHLLAQREGLKPVARE